MEIEVQLYAFLKHYLPIDSKGFANKIQIPNFFSSLFACFITSPYKFISSSRP